MSPRYYRITEPASDRAPNLPPRYNLAPTQEAPVVRRNPETGARSLALHAFGTMLVGLPAISSRWRSESGRKIRS